MKVNILFVIITRFILLRMGNVWDKIYKKNKNTHFMFNNFFKSFPLWDNLEKYSRGGDAKS